MHAACRRMPTTTFHIGGEYRFLMLEPRAGALVDRQGDLILEGAVAGDIRHAQVDVRIGVAGLAVEATAHDGGVEAFSAAPGGAAVLGVQWHPEWQTERDQTSVSFFNLFGRAVRGDTGPWENRETAA